MIAALDELLDSLLDSHRWLVAVLGVLGVLMLYRVVRALRRFTRDFVLPGDANSLARFGAGQPSAWALVSGASEGIGRGYARELARRGLNVVLMARTKSKLEAVAHQLEDEFRVRTSVLAVDFAQLSAHARVCEHLEALLAESGRLAVLVNNVAACNEFPDYYADIDERVHESVVNVNLHTMNRLTMFALKHMIAERGGLILNLGSIAGMHPTSLLTTYSASKAYIRVFSQCIATEYASKGIVCHCVAPGLVVSVMSKAKEPSLMVTMPELIAKRSLDRVGTGDCVMSPYVVHQLIISGLKLLGSFFGQGFVCQNVFNGMKGDTFHPLRNKN